jgi:hypothetical protein
VVLPGSCHKANGEPECCNFVEHFVCVQSLLVSIRRNEVTPFWYTTKVAYVLLLLNLVLPFGIMLQIISPNDYLVGAMAPLWQYVVMPPDYVYFVFTPAPLIYVLWYGPGVYVAWLAYDTTKKQNRTRYGYAKLVILALVIQTLIMAIIPPSSGSPPVLNIPLPIPAILALVLTRWTAQELKDAWAQSESSEEEEDVFEA